MAACIEAATASYASSTASYLLDLLLRLFRFKDIHPLSPSALAMAVEIFRHVEEPPGAHFNRTTGRGEHSTGAVRVYLKNARGAAGDPGCRTAYRMLMYSPFPVAPSRL
jgi:hypothetical protein